MKNKLSSLGIELIIQSIVNFKPSFLLNTLKGFTTLNNLNTFTLENLSFISGLILIKEKIIIKKSNILLGFLKYEFYPLNKNP